MACEIRNAWLEKHDVPVKERHLRPEARVLGVVGGQLKAYRENLSCGHVVDSVICDT